MKKLALSFVVLMVAGVGGAAGAIGCSSSSSTGTETDSGTAGDVTTGGDDGSTEAASGDDTGTTPDTGTAPTDGGTEAASCMTDAGAAFAVDTDAGPMLLTACNTCINTSCAAYFCPCATDTNVDDAGTPDCLTFAGCELYEANAYLAANPDAGQQGLAGQLSGIAMACATTYGTPAASAMSGTNLATCVGTLCYSQCTGQ